MRTLSRWLLAAILLPVFAQADPVTVTNPSFEADVLADGAFASGSFTGWTASGSGAGVFNPSTTAFSGEAPDGSNTAFSNDDTLTQTVGATAVNGTLYSLLVLVGDRDDTAFPGFTVSLLIDGTPVASATSPTPPNDDFTQVLVQYTAVPADAGDSIGIQLDSDGTQANFDLVQLDAASPPGFSKAFAMSTVPVGADTTLTFTINNTANGVAIGNLDFTDNLPAGMVVAPTPDAGTTCTGGTITANAGASVISYTGGTVAANSSCTLSVDVVANSLGVFVNTSGDLTSDAGNSGFAAATLTTIEAPVFTKVFDPDSIPVDEISTLTFLIDNTLSPGAIDSLAFTDNLPGFVELASPVNAISDCGGSLTAVAGTQTVSLSGGSVGAGSTCSIVVDVTAGEPGDYLNVSGDLTSNAGNSGPASDTLEVFTGGPIPTLAWPGLLVLIGLMLGVAAFREARTR